MPKYIVRKSSRDDKRLELLVEDENGRQTVGGRKYKIATA